MGSAGKILTMTVTTYETAATKTLLNLQQVMNANFGAKQCSGKSRYGRAVPTPLLGALRIGQPFLRGSIRPNIDLFLWP